MESKEEMQEEDIDLKNCLFMCSLRSRRDNRPVTYRRIFTVDFLMERTLEVIAADHTRLSCYSTNDVKSLKGIESWARSLTETNRLPRQRDAELPLCRHMECIRVMANSSDKQWRYNEWCVWWSRPACEREQSPHSSVLPLNWTPHLSPSNAVCFMLHISHMDVEQKGLW